MMASVVSKQAGDRGRVLQRAAGHLGRIDDAGFHEVFVFAGGDVVAFVAFALLHFLHDERAFLAGVIGERAERLFDRAADDLHADCFVAFELEAVERFLGSG